MEETAKAEVVPPKEDVGKLQKNTELTEAGRATNVSQRMAIGKKPALVPISEKPLHRLMSDFDERWSEQQEILRKQNEGSRKSGREKKPPAKFVAEPASGYISIKALAPTKKKLPKKVPKLVAPKLPVVTALPPVIAARKDPPAAGEVEEDFIRPMVCHSMAGMDIVYPTPARHFEQTTSHQRFPETLMHLLQTGAIPDCIWWLSSSEKKVFVISRKGFDPDVMNKYFPDNRYKRITLTLKRWGFHESARHRTSRATSSFWHPFFDRENPDLVKHICMPKRPKQSYLKPRYMKQTAKVSLEDDKYQQTPLGSSKRHFPGEPSSTGVSILAKRMKPTLEDMPRKSTTDSYFATRKRTQTLSPGLRRVNEPSRFPQSSGGQLQFIERSPRREEPEPARRGVHYAVDQSRRPEVQVAEPVAKAFREALQKQESSCLGDETAKFRRLWERAFHLEEPPTATPKKRSPIASNITRLVTPEECPAGNEVMRHSHVASSNTPLVTPEEFPRGKFMNRAPIVSNNTRLVTPDGSPGGKIMKVQCGIFGRKPQRKLMPGSVRPPPVANRATNHLVRSCDDVDLDSTLDIGMRNPRSMASRLEVPSGSGHQGIHDARMYNLPREATAGNGSDQSKDNQLLFQKNVHKGGNPSSSLSAISSTQAAARCRHYALCDQKEKQEEATRKRLRSALFGDPSDGGSTTALAATIKQRAARDQPSVPPGNIIDYSRRSQATIYSAPKRKSIRDLLA